MKINVYTIYDSAAQVAERPFVARADGEALRAFGDLCTRAGTQISDHPEQFTLFRIGQYDDNKMQIEPEPAVSLANGVEMVKEAQEIAPGSLNGESVENEISDGA